MGQGEGHMSSGDGNRSRARQASHQVMGAEAGQGVGGPHKLAVAVLTGAPAPPQPTMGHRDVHEQATCGGSMEPLSDPESQ